MFVTIEPIFKCSILASLDQKTSTLELFSFYMCMFFALKGHFFSKIFKNISATIIYFSLLCQCISSLEFSDIFRFPSKVVQYF